MHLVPFDQDPLSVAAQKILESHPPPDPGNCIILVSEQQCAVSLRSALLEQAGKLGFDALLGARIATIHQWLAETTSIENPLLNRPAQELVLAEALRQADPIYANTDPWLLTQQLLVLFDELTRCGLPIAEKASDFSRQLQDSYGLDKPNPALQKEAWILHTLWHAWRRQLSEERVLDPATAYQQQLTASLSQVGQQTIWLIGFSVFSAAEIEWIKQLHEQGRVRLILHGSATQAGYHPDAPLYRIVQQLGVDACIASHESSDPFLAFVNRLFADPEENLKLRAEAFAQQHADPVSERLRTCAADSPEQEAQAIALQVRLWLLDGMQSIAIISEDRLLARRVRALLESSQIELEDAGGWALSTTSAAAVLERWLETLEEDFACGPLLDVLKSPFISFDDREAHIIQVRHLEQDIILHENISRGLERYRHHLDRRSERLPGWSQPMRHSIHRMLNRVEHAASEMLPLLHGNHPASEFLQSLETGIRELGLLEALEQDSAGQRLLEALQELKQAASLFDIPLGWLEFRNWLGRHLETSVFHSASTPGCVRLLTLEQSQLQKFDAAVIAGCSSDKLPAPPSVSAFFNQRVRSELGLDTWSDTLSLKLHHFCRSLFSARQLLVTWHTERDGEPVSASPWVELLSIFHKKAWTQDLRDKTLIRWLQSPLSRPASPNTAALPEKQTSPAPQAAPDLQPNVWSASTHQRIVDCPYRFFAADMLGLKARDEIREALARSDYGSMVHRILQAFHSDLDNLPGPWSGPVTVNNQDDALAMLTTISKAVFRFSVEENFQARSWLKQWLLIAPAYIQWEVRRQQQWHLRSVEFEGRKPITTQLDIKGRIDRIDEQAEGIAVVDFKTGTPPRAADVICGEAVQLTSYALLAGEQVAQLDYLELKDDTKMLTCAEGESLQQLLAATLARLADLDASIQAGRSLPAWGDPKVCRYCEFDGVCRRAMWVHGDRGDA